eukprot:879585-Prymnesium_polylepis.1
MAVRRASCSSAACRAACSSGAMVAMWTSEAALDGCMAAANEAFRLGGNVVLLRKTLVARCKALPDWAASLSASSL